MFSRSLVIPALLAAVPVTGAAWVLSPALLGTESGPEQAAPAAVQRAGISPGLDALNPGHPGEKATRFDVARIGRDGYSVFAGTAPPFSTVTVTADGVPIATTKADQYGEWSIVSDHAFPPGDPALGLAATMPGGPASKDESGRRTPAPARAAAAPAGSAANASHPMMRELESIVQAARKEPARSAAAGATPRAPVPVPVQFVYREATLTEQGRRAAALLLEYLNITIPQSVTLTGHADERGSDAFNMELSRQRLDAIASFLEDKGYAGQLVLVPKGRSEPYRGVDRTKLTREELYQLDRRVELVIGSERSAGSPAGEGR